MTATLLPPHYTCPYGVAEAHAVLFQHREDRGGVADTIAVMIPEAASNLETSLALARALRARVVFICDTATQAEAVRDRSCPLLPDHREVAVGRAEAGAWGLDE